MNTIQVLPVTCKVYYKGKFLRRIAFQQQSILIGRVLSADLQLEDEKVSRIHSVIEIINGGKDVLLFDLGSSNGTQVNGTLTKEKQLVSGDVILIGDSSIVVSLEQRPVSIALEEVPVPITDYNKEAAEGVLMLHEASYKKGAASPEAVKETTQSKDVEEIIEDKNKKTIPEVLEMTMFWYDNIVDIRHFDKPEQITIGNSTKNHFNFYSDSIPENFALVRYRSNKYFIYFNKKITGEIRYGRHVRSLNEFTGMKQSRQVSIDGEVYTELELIHDMQCVVELSKISFFLQFVYPAKKYHISFWKTIDKFFTFILFMVALAQFLFFAYAPVQSEEIDIDTAFKSPNRFTKLVILSPDMLRGTRGSIGGSSDEKGKLPGQEGTKGGGTPTGKGTGGQGKTKAHATPKSGGLLGLNAIITELGKQGKYADIFGKSGLGKGFEEAAEGLQTGSPGKGLGKSGFGGGTGSGGFGTKGSGLGGGGEVVGIGNLGSGGAFGEPPGSGKKDVGKIKVKSQSVITISEEETIIIGSLTREEIDRVVKRNIEQLEYCYDVQLMKEPNLNGKIEITWVIEANGFVQSAYIKTTTLQSPAGEECMLRRVQRWRFPRPRGGGIVEVNYPFLFNAL